MYNPIHLDSRQLAYGFSLIINPCLLPMPYRAISVDPVKINTSLIMMRGWHVKWFIPWQ